MIGQLRIYTVNKGMMDSWLKLFKEEIAPYVKEMGMGIETAWVNEEHSQFIWIRTYEDKSDIEVKEKAFYGSEWWEQNVGRIRGHLAHRDITVIEPISLYSSVT
tara:strand:- start:104 stop:415 length:312 start_codon:yes stop_codon:yes gene_type:complete